MGFEAYVTALTIYRLFESAARDGVPRADAIYKQLAERFKSQRQPAKPDTTGEVSAPPVQ
jgi:hypothetical protein